MKKGRDIIKSKGIVIDEERCKGCGLCIEVCPKSLIKFSAGLNMRGVRPAEFHDEKGECTACTFCALICPDICIEVYK